MALIEPMIKAAIKDAFAQVMNDTEDRDASLDKVADSLAKAVVNAIKSMQITYTTGLISPQGPVTGVFGCTIT